MLCLGLLSGGSILVALSFSRSGLLVIIGLAAVLLGMRLCIPIAKALRGTDTKLYYVLRHQPRRVVWIYGVVTQSMPFGFRVFQHAVVYFKLIDGEELSVRVPVRKIRLITRTLKRLLPHASFGYTEEMAERYREEPGMLLRDNS